MFTITSILSTGPSGRVRTHVMRDADIDMLLAWQSAVQAFSAEMTSLGARKRVGLLGTPEGGDKVVSFGYSVHYADGQLMFEQGPAKWPNLSEAGASDVRARVRRHFDIFKALSDVSVE